MQIDPWAATLGGTAILSVCGLLWRYVSASIGELRTDLANHKTHVAEAYTSKNDLAQFDRKITDHLIRIENKLDRNNGSNHS